MTNPLLTPEQFQYWDSKTNVEALTGLVGGERAYAVDTGERGHYDAVGAAWVWSSGGSGTPGGNDTNIQYNDGGAFGGSDTFIRQSNGAVVIGDISGDIAIEPYSLGQGADGSSIANFLESFGTSVASYLAFLRARGTHTSPTAVMDGDVIGRIRGRAHDGTSWSTTQAEIRMVADGDWSAGDHPARFEFWTTPDGSTTLTLVATITSDGHIDIETGGEYRIGGVKHTHIPIVTSDPGTPADGDMWLLRETTGAIADGTAMGTLGMTYTGNTGATAPLVLSIWDDEQGAIGRAEFAFE